MGDEALAIKKPSAWSDYASQGNPKLRCLMRPPVLFWGFHTHAVSDSGILRSTLCTEAQMTHRSLTALSFPVFFSSYLAAVARKSTRTGDMCLSGCLFDSCVRGVPSV